MSTFLFAFELMLVDLVAITDTSKTEIKTYGTPTCLSFT